MAEFEKLESCSARYFDWMNFAEAVGDHIENYTVPQYGDKGSDQLTNYTSAECVQQAKKYLERFGRNARPGQELLDMMKATHYIQVAYDKWQEENQK